MRIGAMRLGTIRWPVVIALTVLWSLLWGSIAPLTVIGGVLTAIVVLLVFPFPQAMWHGSFRPVPFAILVGRFAFDLVRASGQVAWLAVRPQAPPASAVIRVDLRTGSEFLLTLTAELVSLVPGSLLVELDGETKQMWLHVLDADRDLDEIRANVLAQEERVIAALGSRTERAAYCEGASA